MLINLSRLMMSEGAKAQRISFSRRTIDRNHCRLVGVKGHEVLIKAMEAVVKKFPSTKLMIVGQGREENNLRNLASSSTCKIIFFYSVSNQTDRNFRLSLIFCFAFAR